MTLTNHRLFRTSAQPQPRDLEGHSRQGNIAEFVVVGISLLLALFDLRGILTGPHLDPIVPTLLLLKDDIWLTSAEDLFMTSHSHSDILRWYDES